MRRTAAHALDRPVLERTVIIRGGDFVLRELYCIGAAARLFFARGIELYGTI